jgi:hypothetical protein
MPAYSERKDTESQSLVTLNTSDLAKLHTPVNSSEEGQDDGSVGDLERLERLEELERRVLGA